MRRVAIIGAGYYGFKPSVPELSFREMMFEAATRAYQDAGVDPRSDIDGFVSCQEDYWEGIAIADEFAPEPLGGVLRPTFTVAGDLLQGVAQAVMMIRSGAFDVVAVESHSKQSDIETLQGIYELALDPLYIRPLKPGNPLFLAALDMHAYLMRTGVDRDLIGLVSVKNRRNGLLNPRASYAARITLEDVVESGYSMWPIRRLETASYADGAVVFVLASEDVARRVTDTPVWVEGVGYATEVGTGSVFLHTFGRMPAAKAAADMAFNMAGLSPRDIDSLEIEDGFAFLEPLFLEEMGFAKEGEAVKMLENGDLDYNSALPVNPSGGSQSIGVMLEATGGARLLEAYLQLMGATEYPTNEPERVMVASWRGPPTYTAAAVILSTI
ncbi:MAG: thiolase domain-containing protein [Desulfurococcales archaeon]|nr:thiolase domain-containing protein [Desulfurococcales archaeon]